jgi:hypothetical protein
LNVESQQINALLEAVSVKMRELGVKRFEFEDTTNFANAGGASTLKCSIELGDTPVSEDAAEEERIQRLRDNKELERLDREQRRTYAASSRIGPKFKSLR